MDTPVPERGRAPQPMPSNGELHETLEALDARLARIERSLAGLQTVTDNAPAMLATMTDVADELAAQGAAEGIDVDARLRRVAGLLVRLTDPKVLGVVEMLAERADKIERAIQAADHAPGLFAMVVDILDETAARAAAEGIAVETVVRRTVEATRTFATFVQGEQFGALLESGVLDPHAIEVIGRAGRALADVAQLEPAKTSLFGVMRSAGDADIKRSINFAVRVGKRFGQLLRAQLTTDARA